MNIEEFHRGAGETLQKQALSFRGIPLTILPKGAKTGLGSGWRATATSPAELMAQHVSPYQFRNTVAHEAFHLRPLTKELPGIGRVDLGQSETLARLAGIRAMLAKPARSLSAFGDKLWNTGHAGVDLASHALVDSLPGLIPGTRYGGILGRFERLAKMFPDVPGKLSKMFPAIANRFSSPV